MRETTCEIALKEWAILCRAVRRGRQALLFRKGGILDRTAGGFQVEHRGFFLYPTYYHEKEGDLVPEARGELAQIRRSAPPQNVVHLDVYATVEEAVFIAEFEPLLALSDLHLYSEACLRARHAYRKPGIWAILLRAHALRKPHVVAEAERYAGCVSWVRLDERLSHIDSRPVLSDDQIAAQAKRLREAIGGAHA
jgi:hypothetical protein